MSEETEVTQENTPVEVVEKTPEEIKKETSKQNRINALKRARAAKKVKPAQVLTEKSAEEKEISTMSAGTAIKVEDDNIVWFTEVDFNDKGKVASDYPAYYFDTKELKEEIRVLSENIEDDVYKGRQKRQEVARLKKMEDRLDKIENGRPKLEGKTKDRVVRAMHELGEQLGSSMFSYDSHWKQTADPHTVAERMVEPCIEVRDPNVASFVKQRGFRMVGGKINQNDASIIFKTMCKLIGEPSDTDRLRPIRQHGTTI